MTLDPMPDAETLLRLKAEREGRRQPFQIEREPASEAGPLRAGIQLSVRSRRMPMQSVSGPRGALSVSGALTLTLPMPPNMANGRGHWRVRYRAQLAYNRECVNRYAARLLPTVPNAPPPFVSISSTLYLWAHMDDDNALARIKWAADFCKEAGYIVDDKRPHCRFTIPEQVIDRANQRLVLTLAPLSSPSAPAR